MKQVCALMCVFALATTAIAEPDPEPWVAAEADLITEIWAIDDANPIATGQVDLRLTVGWVTATAPANLGDSDDDFVFTPSLRWGPCANVEVFVSVPLWLGDGGNRGALEDGNYDTHVGFTWRVKEPEDIWPAVALSASARIPTGNRSSGVDGELRLILTNEYDSGIRSHINVFGKSVNEAASPTLPLPPPRLGWLLGGPQPEPPTHARHFQWGFVIGLDGPLSGDGAVRWVADYMNRSSRHYGRGNINQLELGWEWAIAEARKLGMSVQIGLDDNGDTPNFGAALSYAWALTY